MSNPWTRREFVTGLCLGGTSLMLPNCATSGPKTPLAHLHGKEWVHGAYRHYAESYLAVEETAKSQSFESYKQLAQQGATALDGLQNREVPFHIRVAEDSQSFSVARDVPERLMFTAEMKQKDRDEATRVWKIARDHIHQDYEQIQHLDHSLTRLLNQVSRVRLAIDEGRVEQYRVVRQLGQLKQGGELPFELPYQVTRADYTRIIRLLLDRLEADRGRLAGLEASLVTVGLTARATDAGSGTLAASLNRVLLAVHDDADVIADPPPADFPGSDEQSAALQRADKLAAKIEQSEEYQAWLSAQREAEDAIGKLLVVLDSVTGLPTSTLYREVLATWRGDADYLSYLEFALKLLPGGTPLAAVVTTAVGRTQELRKQVKRAGGARKLAESIAAGDGSAVAGTVVNTGSDYARQRLGRQLSFYERAEEVEETKQRLLTVPFMTDPLAASPGAQ